MRPIVDSICAAGILAEHRFAVSSSVYREAKTPWARLHLRLRMYLFYPILLAWACIVDRGPRIFVVTSNTFYAPLIAKMLSGDRQLVVHLVWDLFPDVLLFDQRFASNGVISRLVKGIMQQIFYRATASVFLGQQLLTHAKSQFQISGKTYIVPVGSNARVFEEYRPSIVENHRQVEILYCGNLGTMHDTTTLIEVMRYADLNGIELSSIALTFHASGSQYRKFCNGVRGLGSTLARNILLEDPLNDTEWFSRMRQSHVALVTMRPGSEKIVMPSKTYSALAAGQAILAICPHESDLARLVISEDCGWVVPPGKPDELLSVFNAIATDRSDLHRKRENAFRAGQLKYSEKSVAQQWIRLADEISK
jgi:colanic acid biosynthesis glycosyl transferase WcaI